MLDYSQLQALAAVHRRGSFEAAAAQIGVTQSAISQRVKALEDRTGALLIRRGVPCTATEAGLRLVRHYERVMVLEGQLALSGPSLSGLRIAVNADSLATWVIPALAGVEGFLFDLVIDDQDHSQEWLRRGEVVGAITGTDEGVQGCDTADLGALRYRATASPGFMARWLAEGVTPGALARVPSLLYSEKDRLQGDWARQYLPGSVPPEGFPAHRLASSQGFVEACLHGLGWGMNPEPLVRAHLDAGRLVELVPGSPLDVPLYWEYARATALAIQPLTRALRLAAEGCLIQVS